jgi:hypothetical protein
MMSKFTGSGQLFFGYRVVFWVEKLPVPNFESILVDYIHIVTN